MITRSNKPHFVRSARDKNTRAGNSTLLCLMLNRITKKNMNNYFKIIVDYGLGVEKVFNRFVKLLNKNIKQQRNICWK